jgi:hypothetical protein
MGLSVSGTIFMTVSWIAIILLNIFCFWRILKRKKR